MTIHPSNAEQMLREKCLAKIRAQHILTVRHFRHFSLVNIFMYEIKVEQRANFIVYALNDN